jgi:histidyl-tRNA synthetase
MKAPKGTRDILPNETSEWQRVERAYASVCTRFGYAEIRVPTFEHTELFQRGVGDTTDIVQKEMYTFLDKGGRSLSLRPEGTAGVVRAYIENGMPSLPSPVKLFYLITAFRYENVQKGRYREFHQFGAETFGSAGPSIDAEMIGLLSVFFDELGLARTGLRINSIGCPLCRSAYNEKLRDYLRPHLGQMCGLCNDRFERNPLRVLDCKEPKCHVFIEGAPAQLDHLCEACGTHFEGLRRELDGMGVPYAIDRGIVRGLDYYTRTVFEFVSENVGTQGTICGGGRYDGLVEACGGPATPGIGFALGVERLLMELAAQGISACAAEPPALFLASVDSISGTAARSLCHRMRGAGISCEADWNERSLKAQMKAANRMGVRFTMVLGGDEIQSGKAKLRDMANGSEREVSLDHLAEEMRY